MEMNIKEEVDFSLIEKILDEVVDVSSENLIPILQKIQTEYGYLPPEILMEVSKRTRIPANQIYGVATFYEQFHLEPRGKHSIKCCKGTACHVRGAKNILQALEYNLDVSEGETTKDLKFTVESVACVGTCFLAPVVMIDNDYYGNLTPDKIPRILKKY